MISPGPDLVSPKPKPPPSPRAVTADTFSVAHSVCVCVFHISVHAHLSLSRTCPRPFDIAMPTPIRHCHAHAHLICHLPCCFDTLGILPSFPLSNTYLVELNRGSVGWTHTANRRNRYRAKWLSRQILKPLNPMISPAPVLSTQTHSASLTC